MAEPVVTLAGVHKRYRVYQERYRSLKEILMHRRLGEWEERWALKDVSLKVDRGESLALIGPNGAGKSTTLKLMARILEPDRGSVSVAGRVAGLLELGAGFQPEYTGRENVFLNASLLGLSRSEIEAAFDSIVAFAELEDYIDAPVRTYSSGMFMRLGFAVAIHVRPEILLVDEILAVGDESFQEKCLAWLEGFKEKGGTVVYVSHGLESVRQVCARACWIEGGRIQLDGEAGSVIDAYRDSVHGGVMARPPEPGEAPGRIAEVTLLDRQGRPAREVRWGEPLTVSFRYSVKERIEDPMFGVALHRSDGVYVFGTNTRVDGVELPALEREGTVTLRYDGVDLIAGEYKISIVLFDSTGPAARPVDAHWHRYGFRVLGGDASEGVVRLPHRWQVDSAGGRLADMGA